MVLIISNDWLGKWKNCHGVCQLNVCSEKLSVNNLTVNGFKKVLYTVLEKGYTSDQTLNCD